MNSISKTVTGFIFASAMLATPLSLFAEDAVPALKDNVPFPIGTVISPNDLYGSNGHLNIIKKHFNVIVAENAMKPDAIAKSRGNYDFSQTDKLIAFAKENNITVRWHTLCWHSQTPAWLSQNKNGGKATREEALENLKTYIFTVMEHNKGKGIDSYDVVNECLLDNGKLRTGNEGAKWYDCIGDDYVDYAFKYAHEADPNAMLVINDYSLESNKQKREGMYKLVKGMKDRGIKVDGIGMQMHIDINGPSIKEIKETIDYFSTLGVKVLVTELDMSLYTWDDKSRSLDDVKLTKALDTQTKRYKELFDMFAEEYKAGKLYQVLIWGIDDGSSWKNNFPVYGRQDYPLLFDRSKQPKDCFWAIIGKQPN